MLFKVTKKKLDQVLNSIILNPKPIEVCNDATVNFTDDGFKITDGKGETFVRRMIRDKKPVYLVDHRLLRILKRG